MPTQFTKKADIDGVEVTLLSLNDGQVSCDAMDVAMPRPQFGNYLSQFDSLMGMLQQSDKSLKQVAPLPAAIKKYRVAMNRTGMALQLEFANGMAGTLNLIYKVRNDRITIKSSGGEIFWAALLMCQKLVRSFLNQITAVHG